jgi:ATP-dependent DNA helicase RecG
LYDGISGGEDRHTEFKRDLRQGSDLADEMIAFASTDGGVIQIGIADSGTVVGMDDPQALEEAIQNIARHN